MLVKNKEVAQNINDTLGKFLTIESPGLPGCYSITRYHPPFGSIPKKNQRLSFTAISNFSPEVFNAITLFQQSIAPASITITPIPGGDPVLSNRESLIESVFNDHSIPLEHVLDSWLRLLYLPPSANFGGHYLSSYLRIKSQWNNLSDSQLSRSNVQRTTIESITDLLFLKALPREICSGSGDFIRNFAFCVLMSFSQIDFKYKAQVSYFFDILVVILYVMSPHKLSNNEISLKNGNKVSQETAEAIAFWLLLNISISSEHFRILSNGTGKPVNCYSLINSCLMKTSQVFLQVLMAFNDVNEASDSICSLFTDVMICEESVSLWTAAICSGSMHEFMICFFVVVLLNDSSMPLKEYPQLVMQKTNKYPPPPWHLYISENDIPDITIYFSIQTQVKTTFPKMGVSFDHKELDNIHVSDILSRCISTFGYECSNQYITVDDKKVDIKAPGQDLIKSAMDTDVTFNCTVGESAIKKINHRNYASTEIISSEEAYISDLTELIDYWTPAIRESKLFDEQQLKTLFRDIPTIRNTHTVFLNSLKTEVTFATEFGWKFLNFVQFFKLSATFVSQFKSVDEMLHEKSKNRSFDTKFKEIEANLPAGNGRDFLNYYVTPVQRYPRYTILMREVDKATPLFHPDKPYLAAAMVAVEKVNNEINFSAKRMKQLELMDNLQSSFGGSITINQPGREVLSIEKVRIIKPKSSSGKIILFNDIIIVASINSRKQLQLLINIKNDKFRFSNNRPTPESFMIIYEDKEYVIQFEDYDEKLQWMEEYQKTRNVYFSNIKTNHPYVLWQDIEVSESIPALMNHDGCAMNGSVFFFGGLNVSMSRINTFIRYNFNANTWSIATTPLQPRDSHTVTSLNGKAYICFGHSKKEFFNDCCVFDESQGGWQTLQLNGQTPIGRIGHSCVAYQNKLIFFGGKDKNEELLNDISSLDIKTLEYKQVKCNGDTPSPRMYHSAVVINNNMIIIGGRSEKSLCNDIYSLDLEKMSWKKIPLEIGERMYHKTIAHGEFLIIIGGMSNKDDDEFEVIDTKSWQLIKVKQFGNIPFGISRFACVDIDPKHTIIFGGTDSATRTPIASTYMIDLSHVPLSLNDNITIKKRKKDSIKPNSIPIEHNVIEEHINEEQKNNNSNNNPNESKSFFEKIFTRKSKTMIGNAPSQNELQQVQQPIEPQPKVERRTSPSKSRQTRQPSLPIPQGRGQLNSTPIPSMNSTSLQKQSSSVIVPGAGGVQESDIKKVKQRMEVKHARSQTLVHQSAKSITSPQSKIYVDAIFDAKKMYSILNIDASKMIPLEEVATRRKLKRLWTACLENQELEKEIEWYNMILSNKGILPKDTMLILKIFDDANQTTKIRNITAEDSADKIREIVLGEIKRDAVLYLNTGQTKKKELSQQSLQEAHRSILMNTAPHDLHAIIIVAL
ncbi:Kelch motif family protein [Histomonas meleagridis]|uniref:Kelch motif family protein n=1 Tax=Histomonas meleagridis TaxID=135588 RepID=UPI0035594823|nr:Kelch motif family protein [Histomonas meleagridis]KAH0804051.1 Kelch motif family protein [Histomonas meleagridis]